MCSNDARASAPWNAFTCKWHAAARCSDGSSRRAIVINISLTCYAKQDKPSPGLLRCAVSVAAATGETPLVSYRSRAPPYRNRGIALAVNLQRYRAHKRANIDPGAHCCAPRAEYNRVTARACESTRVRYRSFLVSRRYLPYLAASWRIFGLLSRDFTRRDNGAVARKQRRPIRWARVSYGSIARSRSATILISITLIAVPRISSFPRVGQGTKMASLSAGTQTARSFAYNVGLCTLCLDYELTFYKVL